MTVAAIAAGFIGMILALLEGWIQVSGRMKVIFGTVVLAACVAALVYGAIDFTRETGGPVTWFRDTWRQLVMEPMADEGTSPAGVSSLDDNPSLTRADIWRLTWQQVKKAPLLGAGADNSGLELNRQGSATDADVYQQAQQPNSLVLQVLGDTGLVGALLAFGAILVSIVGILWPRLAVGWGRAKRAWRAKDEQSSKTRQGGSMRGISSRWGDEPMAYGWEMALFAGAAYWFLCANMERLWQMAGVTVPALLMIAAGLAATDARAVTLWPWLNRWWRQRGSARAMTETANAGQAAAAGEEDRQAPTSDRPGSVRPGVAEPREQSVRHFPRGDLRPAGRVSQAFRIALIILSVAVVILSGSAYLVVLL